MRKKHFITIAVAVICILIFGAFTVMRYREYAFSIIKKVPLEGMFSAIESVVRDKVLRQGTQFTYTRTREGKPQFTINAEHTVNFLGGAQTFSKVSATLYGEGGEIFLTGDAAEYDPKLGTLILKDNVTINDVKGLSAETNILRYDEKTETAQSESTVRFRKGAIQGVADRMRYDMASGRLVLEGKVDLDVTEEENSQNGAPNIVIRAETLEYDRIQNILTMRGKNPADAETEFTDGWKSLCAGMHRRETAEDPNQYNIWAPTVVAYFANENLTRVKTIGSTFIEIKSSKTQEPPYYIWGGGSEARYEAESKSFSDIEFTEKAFVRRDDMSAQAERITYDADKAVIYLDGNAELANPSYTLRGARLALNDRQRTLDGTGTIQAILYDGSTLHLPFEGDSPIYFYSDEVFMSEREGISEFRRSAVARRDEDTISASVIRLNRNENTLEASGYVLTRLLSVDDKQKSPVPTIISSDNMRYSEDPHKKAHYRGSVRLIRGDVTVRSDELTAFFYDEKKGESGVERFFAKTNIVLESPGRIGKGDWVEYWLEREEATLGGAKEDIEVREIETGRTARGRILTYGLKRDTLGIYTDAHGRTVSTSNAQNTQSRTQNIATEEGQ